MREPFGTRLPSTNGVKRNSGALAVWSTASKMESVAPQAWQLYEARKHSWSAGHPEASPAEYDRTMRRIAAQCGL